MRVTVYFPPYLVGLKISDWTLAKAIRAKSISNRTNSKIEPLFFFFFFFFPFFLEKGKKSNLRLIFFFLFIFAICGISKLQREGNHSVHRVGIERATEGATEALRSRVCSRSVGARARRGGEKKRQGKHRIPGQVEPIERTF